MTSAFSLINGYKKLTKQTRLEKQEPARHDNEYD
jgi:hypothetical protein